MISPVAFSSLGARAVLGRTLDAGDETAPNVVVLSFETWRRLFQSDRGVIGKTVEFLAPAGDARLLTVVGALPADFDFPGGQAEFYIPLVLENATKASGRLILFGRLRPDVALESGAHARCLRASEGPLV